MKNDNRDFGLIYRENAIYIYRFLLKLGCSPQDAEDITQDAFIKALLNIRSFRGDSSITSWLCQIAKNTYYTYQKRQFPEKPVDTESKASAYELLELFDLMDRLDDPYRDVFIKKALAGWEYSELAAKYGKSESWARVTYYRARKFLQEFLDEGGSENEYKL